MGTFMTSELDCHLIDRPINTQSKGQIDHLHDNEFIQNRLTASWDGARKFYTSLNEGYGRVFSAWIERSIYTLTDKMGWYNSYKTLTCKNLSRCILETLVGSQFDIYFWMDKKYIIDFGSKFSYHSGYMRIQILKKVFWNIELSFI